MEFLLISLLGSITPNLRKVIVIEKKRKLVLNFYYERVNDLEKNIPFIVADRMSSFVKDKEVVAKIIILPFPNPISGSAIYSRYEKY